MKRFGIMVISLYFVLNFAHIAIVSAGDDSQSYDASHFKVEMLVSDGDNSQKGLNMAAAREFIRADDTLNDIYNKVLHKHKNDQEFIDKFIAAEIAWIAFRDAGMEAIFPRQNKQAYGSIYPMSYSIVKAELTWDRVKQLNQWLEGLPEGNVTAGSRR